MYLTQQSSPDHRPGLQVERFGEAQEAQHVRYFLYRDMLDELAYAALYRRQQRCIALLEGCHGLDEDGAYIEVVGFTDFALLSLSTGWREHLRSTFDGKQQGSLSARRRDNLVGCFVSAPHGKSQLEPWMVRMVLTYFNLFPHQMLLVADPASGLLSMYAPQGEAAFCNLAIAVVDVADRNGEVEVDPHAGIEST